MKIIVASDSFKGTLSSLTITRLAADVFAKRDDILPIYLPIADGGEGSLDAVNYVQKGTFITLNASNPYFKQIKTKYFLSDDGIAYIETAETAGLPLIDKLNPLLTTTFGVGEQIKDAVRRGAHTVYLFLGGSATNDLGTGLFSALGTKFYNKNNDVFIPTGGTLKDIVHFDLKETTALLQNVKLIGLSDVTNPLYGPEGAAFVYAPQKGASDEDVIVLDAGLRHLANLINKIMHIDVRNVVGAGSAGGLGASIVAFGKGKLEPGIDHLLNLIKFTEHLKDAAYVITGEGKLDHQSFSGKVISGIAEHALKTNTNVILLVGTSEVTLREAQSYYPNITHLLETNVNKLPFKEVQRNAAAMYVETLKQLLEQL